MITSYLRKTEYLEQIACLHSKAKPSTLNYMLRSQTSEIRKFQISARNNLDFFLFEDLQTHASPKSLFLVYFVKVYIFNYILFSMLDFKCDLQKLALGFVIV